MAVKYDVFVGHSTKDKAVARPPAERLRKDGLKVPSNFGFAQPGMSANAFGSDWAHLEAGTFRFRDPLNQERRFIPVRFDDAPSKVPSRDSFISTDARRACCDGAHLTDFTPLQADKLHGSQ